MHIHSSILFNIDFDILNKDDDGDDGDDDDSGYFYTFKKQKIEPSTNDSTLNLPSDETSIDKILNDVIGIAFTNNQYSTNKVSKDEIVFHLNLTNLCNTITESQQVQLIDIIYQLLSTKFDTTRPPITKTYLNINV